MISSFSFFFLKKEGSRFECEQTLYCILKNRLRKNADEKSKNLHKQRYKIKFCVKLKKMVTEMKEMLNAAYKSAMSQASVYC